MEQLIGVGVLIIKDGRLLLGKRCGSHGAGSWAHPGGHLESGESVAVCAIRETAEETGLVISETRNVGFTNDLFEKEGRQYITLVVEAISFTGVPAVLEAYKCEEWRWFSKNEIPDILFKPLQSQFDQGYQLPVI
ncbi:MAG: 8-oxo-dGTP diphosphatase [bacterium]|jgi:8-oxo-dGTP diphosphatase